MCAVHFSAQAYRSFAASGLGNSSGGQRLTSLAKWPPDSIGKRKCLD